MCHAGFDLEHALLAQNSSCKICTIDFDCGHSTCTCHYEEKLEIGECLECRECFELRQRNLSAMGTALSLESKLQRGCEYCAIDFDCGHSTCTCRYDEMLEIGECIECRDCFELRYLTRADPLL
jgi:hypothetical protein